MKNRPLLLILVCLVLGALVWYDNRPAEKPRREAAATAPAREVAREAADESERAPSSNSVQPIGDGSAKAAGDQAEPTVGEESEPAAGDGAGPAASPEATDADGTASEAASGPESAEVPQSGNPLASLDKSSLRDWVERPLFAPSRKRPPPAAAAGPASKIVGAKALPPSYDLMGVVRDSGHAIALLRKKSDGTSYRVQVGDMLGGWQVSKVEPRAVVLVRDDGTSETVSLFRQ